MRIPASLSTRMKLADKGPIKPPPPLCGPAAATAEAVMNWTEIIAAAHWDLYKPTCVDGVDFYVGEQELGHIHLNAVVHLATSPELGRILVENGLAKRFPYSGAAYDGWVLYRIRTAKDAAHAAWLFRLAYDRIMGITLLELQERVSGVDATENA